MKLQNLGLVIVSLICSTSATREFHRAFQSLRKRSLPTLTSSSSSQTSSSIVTSATAHNTTTSSTTRSSYSATFTAVIPTSKNEYIYRTRYPSGTLFVIVGGIMGLIGLLFFLTWMAFAVQAWLRARREYRLQSIESRYQADPFMFHSKDIDTDYSDGSDGSDYSEKVLKARSSTRLSTHTIYTLGSQSTLNLLQKGAQQSAPLSSANRQSMFISPTEVLKNAANSKSVMSVNTPESDNSGFSGPMQNTDIFTHSDPLYQLAYGDQRTARPPSVHLEKMLDEDE
ncbi:LADA_0B10088g1_1 [Lachancea dasiensis]|uniref:LADA_0B10088g1_1 n=1 Tax=Lachancea dasiensis TaxID=1072105 RepID=A0A1G4IV16_9SACH|nr:LADA_0B10088g1_1 [Lachancea dasiensis]